MLQKLRRRFVGVSLLALAIVLGVILMAAALISYRSEVQQADDILTMLDEQNGEFSDQPMNQTGIEPDAGSPPARPSGKLSPETPFESRYFSVTLSENGQIVSVNLDHIASVNDNEARALTAELSRKSGGTAESEEAASAPSGSRAATGSGTDTAAEAEQTEAAGSSSLLCNPVQGTRCWLHGFRCLVTTDDSGQTMLLFLDRNSRLSSLRSMIFSYLFISLTGLAAVFVLIALLSGRIMRPFAENYEKQRRFITDAGHELKTPIAVIEADADVLDMDLGPNEWVNDIHKQTARLTGLTQDLIRLARMEETREPSLMMDFPLSEVFTECLDSCRGPARAKQIRLTAETDPMLTLYGDEKAIRQLIGILMDNALKYTPAGGEIQAGLHRHGRQIELTVWNTTASMPKDDVPHLFERFYRTDASRSSETGGYGIGLSIARAIVLAHHGKIRAATDDERSLRITAAFPAPRKDPGVHAGNPQ